MKTFDIATDRHVALKLPMGLFEHLYVQKRGTPAVTWHRTPVLVSRSARTSPAPSSSAKRYTPKAVTLEYIRDHFGVKMLYDLGKKICRKKVFYEM